MAVGDSYIRNKSIAFDREIFFYRAFSLLTRQSLSMTGLDFDNHLLKDAVDDSLPRRSYYDSALFWDVIARVGERLYQQDDEGSTEQCLCLLRGAVSATGGIRRCFSILHPLQPP